MFITETEFYRAKSLSVSNDLLGYFEMKKYTKLLIDKFIDLFETNKLDLFDNLFYSYVYVLLNRLDMGDYKYGDDITLEDNNLMTVNLYHNINIDFQKCEKEMSLIEVSLKIESDRLNKYFISTIRDEILIRDSEENTQTVIIPNKEYSKLDSEYQYCIITMMFYCKFLFKYFKKDYYSRLENKMLIRISDKMFDKEFNRLVDYLISKGYL